MKKKILFVINSLEQGGAEKSLVSLLNAFDYENYDVDLMMFRAKGMFLKLVPKEICILPAPFFLQFSGSVGAFFRHPRYLWYRMMGSLGLRIGRKNKMLHSAQCYWKYTHQAFDVLDKCYDAAVGWGQGNPTHFVAEKVYAKVKIAVINTNYEAAGYNRDFDFRYYKKYNHILAVSGKLNALTKKVFPELEDRIETLYDVNNAALIEKMAAFENPFENEPNVWKIVTVGRLSLPKGYDLAVQACRILCDRGVDCKWYIVGEGPLREQIEQDIVRFGIGNHMILVGGKDNPYVYIKNADLYVQTSKFEGYCLTLCEARILNVPIVTTDFDVVHDQIVDEENGLIVGLNGESIADGIMRMMRDEKLRNGIVKNLKSEKKGNIEEICKLYKLLEDKGN